MSPFEMLMIEIGSRHFETDYNVLTDDDIEKFHQDTLIFMEEIKEGTFNESLYDQIQASSSIPENQKSFVLKIYQSLIKNEFL